MFKFKQLLAAAPLALLGLASAHAATAIVPASVTASGTVSGDPATLLTDGDYSLTTAWNDDANVSWSSQEGRDGAVVTYDFGGLYSVADVTLSHDNNDIYIIQVSADGTEWYTLATVFNGLDDGGLAGSGGLLEKSSIAGDASYAWSMDFAPTDAAYARVFARSGDGMYALGEVQFYGSALPVPEPETYAMLTAGLALVGVAGRRRKTA
ncbi:PEP-CTERM sorting domain-containing protein [Parasulfuritortus cantonensis]|uniref:PEP-CTERM sorting domain-containing protein n=1 Tax=Parasulfuritortus cantonensis TaxID=2528202 RepID=A0A4R1B1H8_9PROT|nr:discoidin domain-containing protein [Parasulfuritortus cantonensis]TCJ11631.1 PEP-CTERM sorting domain-containing protein [Parasulfuritortus cantonensis]